MAETQSFVHFRDVDHRWLVSMALRGVYGLHHRKFRTGVCIVKLCAINFKLNKIFNRVIH